MDRSSEVQSDEHPPTGPLVGLRVLDCATVVAAPLLCQVLGDFGADVIKLEHPDKPDAFRVHGRQKDGLGIWWKEVARNKRTVAVNFSTGEGADVLRQLAASADVLVENFRPGTLERWGLDPVDLIAANPRLVVVRLSGFGQTGPYARRAAFGTLVEAMSGFSDLTGFPDGPPMLPGFALADSVAGIAGVGATMMALYHRDARGGRGQIVDLSLLEPMITAVGPGPLVYGVTGDVLKRRGNRTNNTAPRNIYRTGDDQWVALSGASNAIAERVMRLVGHPEVIDEPWFDSGIGRAQNADILDEHIGGWIGQRTRDEVIAAFAEAGAAIAPVYSAADVVNDEHVQQREILTKVADPDFGEMLQHNLLFRLSETPGSIRWSGRGHAADTDEVLDEIGVTEEQRAVLRERGVIR